MESWAAIDEVIDRKRLWRALIDNARSEQARLTDNELVSLLMTLQGFTLTEIAGVLENQQQTGYLGQTRVQQIAQSAFSKALGVGGIKRRIRLATLGRVGRPHR